MMRRCSFVTAVVRTGAPDQVWRSKENEPALGRLADTSWALDDHVVVT
jgi:hypothetical protein